MNKHLKIVILIFYAFFQYSGVIYSQAEQYKFRQLTSKDGLPSNYIWTVMKDSRGFIWITTNAGLCRYDGYNIKVYQYDPADSNSLVHSNIRSNIIEDNKGNLWMGTFFGLNKFDPITEKFTRYINNPDNPGSISSNGVKCLFLDKNRVLWIGLTFNGGLSKYDPLKDSFTNYSFPVHDTLSRVIHSIHEDQSGILWLGTNNGLYQFDRKNEKYIAIEPVPPLPDNFISEYIAIREDNHGNLWFLTPKAILSYINETNRPKALRPLLGRERQFNNSAARDLWVEPGIDGQTIWIAANGLYKVIAPQLDANRLILDQASSKSLTGIPLNQIFRDENGILWASTEFGLYILDIETIHLIEHPDFLKKYNSSATAFLEDSRGSNWIGTFNKGVIHFDRDMNKIHWYDVLKSDEEGNNITGIIKDIIEDSEGNIWVGDFKTGLYYLDRNKNEFVNCNLTAGPFTGVNVYDIHEDSEGSIWAGTYHGVYRRKSGVKPLTHFSFIPLTKPPVTRPGSVHDILEDRSGYLWICVNALGLFCQPPELKGTDTFIHYFHDPGDNSSLSNDNIMSVYEDSQNNIWIGTRYGLNRFNKGKGNFNKILFDLNKASNFISDITEDNSGNLWLTTQYGLLRYKIPSKDNINKEKYEIKQFLQYSDLYPLKNFRSKDGKIFIGRPEGSVKGYITFYPDSIEKNQHIPPVVITNFYVNNKQVEMDSSFIVKKHIQLNYNENFFTFEFSALDYTNPDKNQYAYYLEGIEKDWIYSGNRRFANYTGINPGYYVFHVKGSNNDGYWNETGTSLSITILPPPWKTWWAYLLYSLFLIGVLFLIIRYYIKKQKLQHKFALEQIQTEKLEELDKLKSRFFANISHEFRTPLTLILGPLEKLRSRITDPDLEQNLNMMQRNARRLQNLINQLLSLSKIESGQMKLHAKEENIVVLVNGYVQLFESLAKQRGIELVIRTEADDIKLFVDKDKFEKILYNLLSNAFKYTPEGSGRITISLVSSDLLDNYASISVSNTGTGIPIDHLPHIFDRFYQADDSSTHNQEGTGIGLALTKELIELHHGKIIADSQKGKGATFTIYIPIGNEHLTPEEIVDTSESEDAIKPLETMIQITPSEIKEMPEDESDTDNSRPLLLIVEDNDDLRSYIHSFLAEDYRISEALDGVLGLKKAIEIIPDLVISDVMMPNMDGYQLCHHLKSDERTSHIPVILLTARASMESKIEGLEKGADDFITKPFDILELKTRIRNLIEQRRRLQLWILNEIRKPGTDRLANLDSPDLTSMDQKFYKRVIQSVLDNVSNPDFNVGELVSMMNMSHSQLHRKMVAITGQTANHFIRTIRLSRAAELLANKTATISEIAFETGFNNLSYFAKCFRDQFGTLPSEYTDRKS